MPNNSIDPADWAKMLLKRDNVQGRRTLERMIAWYDEHDGKRDDFGELWIVSDARAALAFNKDQTADKNEVTDKSEIQKALEDARAAVLRSDQSQRPKHERSRMATLSETHALRDAVRALIQAVTVLSEK